MALELFSRETKERTAPYAPATTFIQLLHRLRSRNVPDRIDADYLDAAGIPTSLVSRAAFALRYLSLVEGESPSQALRDLASSTDEEYRSILDRLVRDAYADIFVAVDPAEDPPDRISNMFKKYTPASQRERMANFFVAMCREAGMEVAEGPRPRSGATANSKAAKPRQSRSSASRDSQSSPAKRAEPMDTRPTELPPALELLVRSLPVEGTPMPKERRQQWIAMAEATLKFVYPEESVNGATEADGEEIDED